MQFVIGLFVILFLLAKCSGHSGTTTAGAGHSGTTTSEHSEHASEPKLLSEAEVTQNKAADCANAKYEIESRDYALERSFHEWRSQQNASYEAQKSAYLRNWNTNGSLEEGNLVTGKATEYEKYAVQHEEENKKQFYSALREANYMITTYNKKGCITIDSYGKKLNEYLSLPDKP
jgi:hypothetical protein